MAIRASVSLVVIKNIVSRDVRSFANAARTAYITLTNYISPTIHSAAEESEYQPLYEKSEYQALYKEYQSLYNQKHNISQSAHNISSETISIGNHSHDKMLSSQGYGNSQLLSGLSIIASDIKVVTLGYITSTFNTMGRVTNICLDVLARNNALPYTVSPYHNLKSPQDPHQAFNSKAEADKETGFYYMVAAGIIVLCLATAYIAPKIINRIKKSTSKKPDTNSENIKENKIKQKKPHKKSKQKTPCKTMKQEPSQEELNTNPTRTKPQNPITKNQHDSNGTPADNFDADYSPNNKKKGILQDKKDDKEDRCSVIYMPYYPLSINDTASTNDTANDTPNTTVYDTNAQSPNAHQSESEGVGAGCLGA